MARVTSPPAIAMNEKAHRARSDVPFVVPLTRSAAHPRAHAAPFVNKTTGSLHEAFTAQNRDFLS
jgi:hypothetical protein